MISQPSRRARPSLALRAWGIALILSLVFAAPFHAHEPRKVEEVTFSCPVAELAGTLLLPAREGKVSCVVIVGGSLSHTRDGALARKDAPPRDALKRLAEALEQAGCASLRYDKPRHGGSWTTKEWRGSYFDESQIAAAAIRYARSRTDLGPVIVAGESAGAYLACLAAKDGVNADGYLFLGGLCGSAESMYEHTFGGLAKYAASSPDRLAWAEKNVRHELALGRHYKEMLQAAADKKEDFELTDGDYSTKIKLDRRREELRWPPDEMFKHIKAPALALAGEKDLNVPPEHALRIVGILQKANNPNGRSKIIPAVDHSFQTVPNDEDQRFRDRYTFSSFRRPYEPQVYKEIATWLQKNFPVGGKELLANPRAKEKPETDPKTETTPERLQLAPGIEIINDITDKKKTAGVETLEGRIGPLLLAEKSQCHFIDMPSGMYVAEHPHSKESIIYTVKGQWVLCSQGRRHVMKAGSLFRFAPGISTGYEVPFAEDAYILIFKGERLTKVEKEFIDYLTGFAERLKKEQKEGVPFLLKDLPREHPARVFAREVSPTWSAELDKKK